VGRRTLGAEGKEVVSETPAYEIRFGSALTQGGSFNQSQQIREYSAEMNVPFPCIKGLNIQIVWVFAPVLVCLECGKGKFTIPDAERTTLIERDCRGRADGAALSIA
jgi:hypothetical protein